MFDWFERRSSYILVMERPQPVIDLFDYLNQHGAMPEPTAKKIFRQVTSFDISKMIRCFLKVMLIFLPFGFEFKQSFAQLRFGFS